MRLHFETKLRMYCAVGSATATIFGLAAKSHGQVYTGAFSHNVGGNDSGSIALRDAFGKSFLDTGDDNIDGNHQLGTDGNFHAGAHLYLSNKALDYKANYLYTGSANTGAVANLPVGSVIGSTTPAGTTFENSESGTDNDIAYTDSSTGTVYTPSANSTTLPTQFSTFQTGYYGFSIQPNGGSQTDYGYAAITFDAAGDVSGTFAYNTTGNPITVAAFAVSNWNSSGGDFSNASNWIGGVPGGVNSEAVFNNFSRNGGSVNINSAVTLGTVRFFNKNIQYSLSGTGSLNLNSSTGSALIVNEQGTHSIGVPVTFVSAGAVNVVAGANNAVNTLNINAPLTFNGGGSIHVGIYANLTVTSPTTVAAGQTFSVTSDNFYGAVGAVTSFSAFNIGSGAKVSFNYNYPAGAGVISMSSLTAGAGSAISLTALNNGAGAQGKLVLQLGGISLSPTTKIDLQANDLILQGSTTLSAVNTLVQTGYNGGKWNGSGIASTTVAADTTKLTVIGVIQNTTDGSTPIYGGTLGSFDGVTPNATDILVRYTYYGDSNLDGQVDGSDYSTIDNGFLQHLSGWYNGDFNYDGSVNGSDYTLIDNAFNSQQVNLVNTPAGPAVSIAAQVGSTSAVPEPASLSLLALGAVGLLRRKRA